MNIATDRCALSEHHRDAPAVRTKTSAPRGSAARWQPNYIGRDDLGDSPEDFVECNDIDDEKDGHQTPLDWSCESATIQRPCANFLVVANEECCSSSPLPLPPTHRQPTASFRRNSSKVFTKVETPQRQEVGVIQPPLILSAPTDVIDPFTTFDTPPLHSPQRTAEQLSSVRRSSTALCVGPFIRGRLRHRSISFASDAPSSVGAGDPELGFAADSCSTGACFSPLFSSSLMTPPSAMMLGGDLLGHQPTSPAAGGSQLFSGFSPSTVLEEDAIVVIVEEDHAEPDGADAMRLA